MADRAITIDKTTKVNLGILLTLLTSLGGGAVYLTRLNGHVIQVVTTLHEVRKILDNNTAKLDRDGRTLAVLETLVGTIERRVTMLELLRQEAENKREVR